MNMRRTYIFLGIIFLLQSAFSQEYKPVERFTVNSGLSDDEVKCIFQDQRGYLWIGTRSGLLRYDGYQFERFRTDISDRSALPSSNILKIITDDDDQLWIITPQGISKYNRASGTFQSFILPHTSGAPNSVAPLQDAVYDPNGDRILVFGRGSLYSLEPAAGKMKVLDIPGMSGQLSSLTRGSLCFSSATNSCFIYSSDELIRIRLDENVFQKIQVKNNIQLMQEGGILDIKCEPDGQTWICSQGSIWVLTEGDRLSRFMTISDDARKKIITIASTDSVFLHILTTSDLLRINKNNRTADRLFTYSFPGADETIIHDILRIEDHIFWLGTTTGLYQFNEHKNRFRKFDIGQIQNDPEAKITSMEYDEAGRLWIGTSSGAVYLTGSSELKQDITVLAEGRVNSPITGVYNSFRRDTVLLRTSRGLYFARRSNRDIITNPVFQGIPDAAELVSRDSLFVLSGDSLFFISPSGRYRMSSRKIDTLADLPVLDMFVHAGRIFLLQNTQMINYRLSDSTLGILNLSRNGLHALPANTCFFPSGSREILVGTTSGMYIFYPQDPGVLPSFISLKLESNSVTELYQTGGNEIWFSTRKGLFQYNRENSVLISYTKRDGLDFPKDGFKNVCSDAGGRLCFAADKFWIEFHPDSMNLDFPPPQLDITKLEIITKSGLVSKVLNVSDTLRIDADFSMLRFHCTVLDFWDPQRNYVQYALTEEGNETVWNSLSRNTVIDIPRLKPGIFHLKLRAANSRYIWSSEVEDFVIVVETSFWRSKLAIAVYILFFLLAVYFLIYFTTRQLRRLNREYREKEQIAKKVEQQKEELTQKNKNITDSINYAKRIQMALMPSQRLFSKIFTDSFILHIPKDIVSGDFYWVNQVDKRIYFAAVDCTGHGVPGAFMSIIGFELFRRITEIEKKKRPAEILNSLSLGFESIFRDIEDITLRDGMDVAFCAIDPEMRVLEFAGAFNPLYLIRDNTISEIKGDRFSVGLNQTEDGSPPQEFQDHVIHLKEGDILYIFTDGYADQFGGPEGKKYKYRRFRHLLLALHQLPMDRQVEFLRRSIMDWKGDLDQVDDILVIGIRISQKKEILPGEK